MADRQEIEQVLNFRNHSSGDYVYEPDGDEASFTVVLKAPLYGEFDAPQRITVNVSLVEDPGDPHPDAVDMTEETKTDHDTAGGEAFGDNQQPETQEKAAATKSTTTGKATPVKGGK